MSNVLSSLQVVLGADTAAFQQDLGRASESANDNFGKIGDAAKAMAATLAAAFTVDYIKDNIKKAIDYADAMSDLAGKTGIATEELTAMEYALKFSDATLESYTEGIKKLAVNMVSSIEGNKDLADTFKKLGVSVVDAQGNVRQSKDVFLDAAEAISKMQDGAIKTDLAMKLFGKSAGPELIPFLNQGKEGIRALKEEAQEMGAVVSTEMAEQSAQFNDNLAKMDYAAKGVWNSITTGLLPSLNNLASATVDSTKKLDGFQNIGKMVGKTLEGMAIGANGVALYFNLVGEAIGKTAARAQAYFSGDLAMAAAIKADNTGIDKINADIENLRRQKDRLLGTVDNETWADDLLADLPALQEKLRSAADDAGKITNAIGGSGDGKNKKIKTAKEAKDNFDYGIGGKSFSEGSVSATEYNNATTSETLSNQGYLANQLIVDEAARQELYTLYDKQNAAEITNNALKLDMQRDFVASFLTMDRARVDGSVTNGDAALEAHKKQQQMTVTFFQNGLDSMAAGHGKAAKAAQSIQKAQALYEIGVNTYRAAMGARAALSSIPIVGPALGIAAAAAAIAFGGSMAQGVMKGGGAPSTPSVSGSTPSSSVLTGSNEIVPISQQQNQTTYIRIPEDRMMTGRQLIDFIDEALGDGKQFNNFRFIPA